MAQFSVIFQDKFGDTVESDNPKLDAYKHMAYLHRLGYHPGLLIRDGQYTVQAETITQKRIADITFKKAE